MNDCTAGSVYCWFSSALCSVLVVNSPFTFPLCLFHCSHYKDIDVNMCFFFFSKITFVHVQRLWIPPPQSVVGNSREGEAHSDVEVPRHTRKIQTVICNSSLLGFVMKGQLQCEKTLN